MKRPWMDRLQDRIWVEWTARQQGHEALSPEGGGKGSVSGGMGWPLACRALVDGKLGVGSFRRHAAVREVVETLGPTDGRHFGRKLLEWGFEGWDDPVWRRFAGWGGPLEWPGFLMGVKGRMAPTSLRYLAHAWWLKRLGWLGGGRGVVEIGVGYGGMAAMNGWVSRVRTLAVDLPEVVEAARLATAGMGFPEVFAETREEVGEDYCLISNYAFTELSREWQDRYADEYLSRASCGFMISNAAVFAGEVGGRGEAELVEWMRGRGVPVKRWLAVEDELLARTDRLAGVSVLAWGEGVA